MGMKDISIWRTELEWRQNLESVHALQLVVRKK